MLEFKKVGLYDAELLLSVFEGYTGRICDYSAGNTLFWRDHYKTSFYLDEDGFVLRYGDMGGRECYSYPIAKDPAIMINKLLDGQNEICITCMTNEEYESVCASYTLLETIYSEDWDDYVYDADDIVYLRGRRYNGQRNHINKFKKSYPDASFEIVTEENALEAAEFCKRYFHGIGKDTVISELEERRLIEQFENWGIYRQSGGMLKVGETVVGLSVGELVGDTLIIHTEKADTSYTGAYPMLTNCFAREFANVPRCRYINREEDCGEEDLRISKRSYHPSFMLKKYAAVIRK